MEFDCREKEHDVVHPIQIDAEETRRDANREPRGTPMEIEDAPTINTQSRITFLELPEDIKIRILKYAGLLRPCLINFAYEKNRAKHDRGLCHNGNPVRMTRLSWTGKWLSPYHGTCDHPPLPVGVFLASRAAREELGALFFAQNRFCIYLYGRHESNLFNTATEWGLLHLKRLHLNLGGQSRYLKLTGGVHRTTLNIWKEFCDGAVEKMPSLRYFSMKCKVKELVVAIRLMCIIDPFPPLSHCAFHFSDVQDDDIRPVIKRAAWRLTGNLSDKPPFPFMKLPKEVQLMILEHVLIKRSDPFLPAMERNTAMVGLLDRKYQPTTNSPLACCGTCSPLRAQCFCEARQTAFSTSCTCFSSPIPYFLVSRQFYEDCRRLFFSKNHFTFVDEEPDPIMRFLTSIPTSSFMLIRHLSFKFPLTYRMYHRSARSEESIVLSWSVLRRFIREHFDLQRLSLNIVDLGTRTASVSRNKYMRRMLKEFAELQGLRDFRVYLADDPSFEKELERAVMGRTSVGRYRPYNTPSVGGSQYTST
ncbi:hypothetical protein BDW62DRAFT_198564 [Aspergillus aurantiobrunneus]